MGKGELDSKLKKQVIDDVELLLDETDKMAEEDSRRYSHEEMFSKLRRKIFE